LWAKKAEDRLAAFEAGRMKSYPADQVLQEFADLVAIAHLHREPGYWVDRI